MTYKPWREMTAFEKKRAKWIAKGRPRLIWDSQRRGTCRSRTVPGHYEVMYRAHNAWLAKLKEEVDVSS